MATEYLGERVRALRRERRWTQSELAGQLGVSQGNLSQIESGKRALSAVQLLTLLRLFNVHVSAFSPVSDDSASIQNALARYGASHLRETREEIVSANHSTPRDVVRSVLLQPRSLRLVTALAPVLVRSIDDIPLPALQHDLVSAGVPFRLPWLIENTLTAVERTAGPRSLEQQRAKALLGPFMAQLPLPASTGHGSRPTDDPFEQGLRSRRGIDRTKRQATEISAKWRIVSSVQVADFVAALESAIQMSAES